MSESAMSTAGCVQYELDISINAARERVWQAIIEETNAWWLPDFRMVEPQSQVQFDVRPGGRGLIEIGADGSFLSWYSVQFYLPQQFKVYLVGNIAPEWGGPSTSNLCLSLREDGDGCILKVADAQHGSVSAGSTESLQSGWNQLFGEGLRVYVEQGR